MINQWPYTNLHALNLDWVLNEVKALSAKIDTISPSNAVVLYDTLDEANNAALPIGSVFGIKKIDDARPYSGFYSVTIKQTPIKCGDFYALPLDVSADAYGAYSDGSGDNAALFQSLVDLNMPIFLSTGIYKINTPIDCTNKALFIQGVCAMRYEIESPSCESRILAPNGAIICNNTGNTATDVHGTITCVNIEFAGANPRYSPVESYFANCLKQAYFSNCVIRCFAGTVQGDMHIGGFDHCLIAENSNGLSGKMYDCTVSNSYIVGNYNAGIKLVGAGASVISKCKVEFNNNSDAITINNGENVVISDCTTDRCSHDITLTSSKNVDIRGLMSRECENGASIYNCSNVHISMYSTRSIVDGSTIPIYHSVTIDESDYINCNVTLLDTTNDATFSPVHITSTCNACNAIVNNGYQSGVICANVKVFSINQGSNQIVIPITGGTIDGVYAQSKQVFWISLSGTSVKTFIIASSGGYNTAFNSGVTITGVTIGDKQITIDLTAENSDNITVKIL